MKNFENYLMYGTLVMVIATIMLSFSSIFHFDLQKTEAGKADTTAAVGAKSGNTGMGARLSRMSLTGFDVAMAKQFMDKDGDGKCDACGMPVEMCIGSGQMQCNMDPSSTIGVLGSQHIHADLKVYVDGKPFDFSPFAMDMSNMNANSTSNFIHVDKGAVAPERTSDVIHMHAKGVRLWLFFRSVGGDFNETCLTLLDNQQFCNTQDKKLRFYVSGKPNAEFGEYVFNNLDKILISYGSSDSRVQEELNAITDFAKGH